MEDADIFCVFTSPVVALSLLKVNAIKFFVSCDIPEAVKAALNSSVRSVTFDLINNRSATLLKQVEVRRFHRMDRRSFNVSLSTMTMGIDSPMLRDWIVYYLALGVQHFYIYDNRHWFPSHGRNGDITASHPLKPFLDANLITLIYHPFLSTDNLWYEDVISRLFIHYSSILLIIIPPFCLSRSDLIQVGTINHSLEAFGTYNQYIGFVDIDEFFKASANLQQEKGIYQMLLRIEQSPQAPKLVDPSTGVCIDTFEVKCDDGDERIGGSITHCLNFGAKFHQFNYSNGTRLLRVLSPNQALSFFKPLDSGKMEPVSDWKYEGHGKTFTNPAMNPKGMDTVHCLPGCSIGECIFLGRRESGQSIHSFV